MPDFIFICLLEMIAVLFLKSSSGQYDQKNDIMVLFKIIQVSRVTQLGILLFNTLKELLKEFKHYNFGSINIHIKSFKCFSRHLSVITYNRYIEKKSISMIVIDSIISITDQKSQFSRFCQHHYGVDRSEKIERHNVCSVTRHVL